MFKINNYTFVCVIHTLIYNYMEILRCKCREKFWKDIQLTTGPLQRRGELTGDGVNLTLLLTTVLISDTKGAFMYCLCN